MSTDAQTPNDESKPQEKPPTTKGRKRTKPALDIVAHYATSPDAPTLLECQAAAEEPLVALLVAYYKSQKQEP